MVGRRRRCGTRTCCAARLKMVHTMAFASAMGKGGQAIRLCLLVTLVSLGASAQKIVKSCPSAQVLSVVTTPELQGQQRFKPRPRIEILRSTTRAPSSASAGRAVDLIALGPVLGSMDSPKVRTRIACTEGGFALVATITRSANFHGSAMQNAIWRPRIRIEAVPRRPQFLFRSTWRMRLTNGAKVKRTQTPTYPSQRFPVTVEKTIRVTDARSRTSATVHATRNK